MFHLQQDKLSSMHYVLQSPLAVDHVTSFKVMFTAHQVILWPRTPLSKIYHDRLVSAAFFACCLSVGVKSGIAQMCALSCDSTLCMPLLLKKLCGPMGKKLKLLILVSLPLLKKSALIYVPKQRQSNNWISVLSVYMQHMANSCITVQTMPLPATHHQLDQQEHQWRTATRQ